MLEYRDLSAWRVSIPRLATGQDGSGRLCFVFVISIQRIDVNCGPKSNADFVLDNNCTGFNVVRISAEAKDLHWEVGRRYSEFYALEAKLTEFHGELEDARLPMAKSKLFAGRGLDVMQARMHTTCVWKHNNDIQYFCRPI